MIARTTLTVVAALFLACVCFGQTWRALPRVILQDGDVPPGGGGRPVFYVSGPVQDGWGTIGLVGHLDNGDGTVESFLWVDDRIRLLASQVNANTFHGRVLGICRYSFPIDSRYEESTDYAILANDASGVRVLRSHRGVVMRAGGHGPGLPPDAVIQDFRNMQMLPTGTLYFNLSYFNGSQKTAQYVSHFATANSATLLFKDGDIVDGATIRRLGLAYDWCISDDGLHHTQIMSVTPDSGGARKAVYFDGQLILFEDDPAGFGETWKDFTSVATNNLGYHLMGGSTDSSSSNDDVLAMKGRIVQREGEVVDGIHLTSPAMVGNIHIDNDGRAIYLWARRGLAGPYAVFFTPNIDDFGNTRHVVSEGAGLDFDGDGSVDAHLDQFRSDGGPTLAFGPNNTIYIAASIRRGSDIVRGVLQYPMR